MRQQNHYPIQAFKPSVDNGVRPMHPFLQNQITLTHPEIHLEEPTNWVYNSYIPNAIEVLMGGRCNQNITTTIKPNGTMQNVYSAPVRNIEKGGYDKEWLAATNQHRVGFLAATQTTMLY